MMRQLPVSVLNTPNVLAAEISRQHSEGLQIVNQRFQLMTIAIVGTVTIIGWFANRVVDAHSARSDLIVDLAIYVTFAGLGFLTALYVLSHMLYRTIRIFNTLVYVRYEEPSGSILTHEHLWERFRHRRYRAYSAPFGSIYCILALGVWALPWMLRVHVGSSASGWAFLDWVTVATLGAFIGLVVVTTWGRKLLVSEEELRRTWRAVIAEIDHEPPNKALEPMARS